MNEAPYSVVDCWPKMCLKLKYNQDLGDVFEKDEYMIMMTVMLIIIMNEGSGVGSQVPSLEVGGSLRQEPALPRFGPHVTNTHWAWWYI